MTDQTNVPADGNAESQASGDIDAQLAEMHSAETQTEETQTETRTEEGCEAEKPEVKKVVPLAALHEERRERQRLQRQIEENQRAHAEAMQRINQRLEALVPKQQLPDREQQPVEYLDHRLNELTATQRQILERDQQREQAAQQQAALQQVASVVMETAAAFRESTPDFPEALKHLNETRTRQLTVLGMAEDQARAQATKELDQAAIQWTVNGKNAAQVAYEFAKAQGYTPKAQQSAAEKITAQQKGTAAARSLGGGGAVSAGKLTAEALANMSDADFAKLTDEQFRQAMGG
jgi:hypothetical protein